MDLGLALTSMLFNYVLGEEFLFRGVLLPRMSGVFGRWDWVANTVLFGLYHVHKIWAWPSMIASSFGIAWATKRYRSFWMGVIVHGFGRLLHCVGRRRAGRLVPVRDLRLCAGRRMAVPWRRVEDQDGTRPCAERGAARPLGGRRND